MAARLGLRGTILLNALLGGVGVACLLGAAAWLAPGPDHPSESKAAAPIPKATSMRRTGEGLLARGDLTGARETLLAVIEGFGASRSQLEQDEVSASRIRLGYLCAREDDFKEAERWFDEAAAKHRGSEAASPDYGGLVDQAAYQAAVCRAKDLTPKQAGEVFMEFADDHPRSPLVHAALKRIQRLGTPSPAMVKRFDALAAEQQAWAKKEAALCGPKALARVLELLGKTAPPIEELARLSKTSDRGTTMGALKEALRELGLYGVGMRVNRVDFALLPAGSLWLKDGHFLVFERAESDRYTVFDPFTGRSQERPLPEDVEFTADVLVVRESERKQP